MANRKISGHTKEQNDGTESVHVRKHSNTVASVSNQKNEEFHEQVKSKRTLQLLDNYICNPIQRDLCSKHEQASQNLKTLQQINEQTGAAIKLELHRPNKPAAVEDVAVVQRSITNVDSRKISHKNNWIKDKWTKIWEWHGWISSQPSGKGKLEWAVCITLYISFLVIASILSYQVLIYPSVYTDVQLKSMKSHPQPIPDMISCPPKGKCSGCPDAAQHFQLSHDVWWNSKMLEFLNISESNLNLLASIMQQQAFEKRIADTPPELVQYVEKARSMVKLRKKQPVPEHECFRCSISDPWNCSIYNPLSGSNFELEDLWCLIVKFPKHVYKFLKYNHFKMRKNTNFYKHFARVYSIEPRTTWVNNAYCLLFQNDKGLSFQFKQFFGIGSFSSDVAWSSIYFNEVGGAARRIWFGNLSSDSVVLEQFHLFEFEKNYPEYNVYKGSLVYFFLDYFDVEDSSNYFLKYSECQEAISALKTSHDCKPKHLRKYIHSHISATEYFREYWLTHSTNMANVFLGPGKVWSISKRNTYAMLEIVELLASIFCLFLGTSAYQLLLIMFRFINKKVKWEKFVNIMKYFMGILLFILAISLFNVDLKITLEPKLSHQLSLETGKHKIPAIAFHQRFSSFLNYSKIQELNISLGLLQYILIASAGQLPETMIFNRDILVSPHPLHPINIKLNQEEEMKRLDTGMCEGTHTKLQNEYKTLADTLGISSTVPAYHLWENITFDKCILIEYCIINGIRHNDCCRFFKYELMSWKGFSLVFETPEYFVETNLGQPDFEVKFSEWIYDTTKLESYANSIGEYTPMYSEILEEHIDVGWAWLYDRNQHGFVVRKSHRKSFHLLLSKSEAEIQELAAQNECKEKLCYGQLNQVKVKHVNRALRIFKLCGCYICFGNEDMKTNLELKHKCCSPQKAVKCLTNPLFYTEGNRHCPTVKFHCSDGPLPLQNWPNDSIQNKANLNPYCLAGCSKMLAFKNLANGMNCTERIDVNCNSQASESVHCTGSHARYHNNFNNYWIVNTDWIEKSFDMNYANFDLHLTEEDVMNYGCTADIKSFQTPACFLLAWIWNEHEAQATQISDVTITLSRQTAANNFLVDRSVQERSYNAIEIIGLFLGAYGLFIGLDVIVIVAFLSRFHLFKHMSVNNRFLKAYNPVEAHWLRNFRSYVTNIVTKNTEDSQSDDKHAHYLEAKYSKICIVISIISLLIGFSVTMYVALSDLLNVQEYNMEFVHESSLKQIPSVAICTKFRNGVDPFFEMNSYISQSRCWVSMIERNCSTVFDLQVSTGKYFCWIAADTNRFITDDYPFKIFHFSFVFAGKDWSKFKIWHGHLSHVTNYSEIIPETPVHHVMQGWRVAKPYVVYPYQKFTNFSCTVRLQGRLPCPDCSDFSLNKKECCIYKRNVSVEFLEKQHQCPQVRYLEQQHIKQAASWLTMSNIWKDVRSYNVLALKQMHPFSTEIKTIQRHSTAAKFALAAGWLDLFVGISILNIGGTALLPLLHYIRSRFHTELN